MSAKISFFGCANCNEGPYYGPFKIANAFTLMPRHLFGRGWPTNLILFCAAFMGGCAIQTDRRGELQLQVDGAELFGQTVKIFNLPDGSEARLRVLDGKYSIKLQRYLRVIPIENATEVKVRSTAVIDGRGIIVIEKAERNCGIKTQLLSIKEAEVLGWDFGNCQSTPKMSLYPEGATFDFAYPRSTIRYTYKNAKLVRNEYNGTPPALQADGAAKVASEAPRHVPGPPSAPDERRPAGHTVHAADASDAKPVTRGKPSPTRNTPSTPRPLRVPAPAPTPAMNFPAQEQKPVRIVLDN